MATIDPTIMESVARRLLGDPNQYLSSQRELRFGTRGTLSVDLDKGVFYDHEAGEGGGILDLIRRQLGLMNGAASDWLKEEGLAEGEERQSAGHRSFNDRIDAVYRYEDAAGAHAYDVVRLRNPKDFRQKAPDGSWSTEGVPRVLYRLPDLIAAPEDALVFFVEGEKDVDKLLALGLRATTAPEGAGKWRDRFADNLKYLHVAIVPDNDQPGELHAQAVLASLQRRGIAAGLLHLDGLPPKGDVSDWLDAGGTAEKLVEMALGIISKPNLDLTPTQFQWIDPMAIPPRPWLYGRHLLRRQVSVTVATGGVGKSALVIAEGVAMASGRTLLGEWVAGPLRVWIWNLEDPRDELQRRVTATMLHHRVGPAELADRLFVDSGRDRSLCTALQTKEGVSILKPVVDAVEAALEARQIDVLRVDPFISSHQVPENDNGAIDLVVKEWARIAERCDCSIELVHHVRKTGGEATSEDGRGGSALLAAARSGRVLNKMTDAQRVGAGVENDPVTYFSVARDKANLAPEGQRVWCRMASVDLGQGDLVGVAEAWEWPDAFEGVTVADLLRVQQAIDGKNLRFSDQAKDWAGHAVADVLGLNTSNDQRRIKALITGWIKSGALVKGSIAGPQRKPVPTLEVGEWATE